MVQGGETVLVTVLQIHPETHEVVDAIRLAVRRGLQEQRASLVIAQRLIGPSLAERVGVGEVCRVASVVALLSPTSTSPYG